MRCTSAFANQNNYNATNMGLCEGPLGINFTPQQRVMVWWISSSHERGNSHPRPSIHKNDTLRPWELFPLKSADGRGISALISNCRRLLPSCLYFLAKQPNNCILSLSHWWQNAGRVHPQKWSKYYRSGLLISSYGWLCMVSIRPAEYQTTMMTTSRWWQHWNAEASLTSRNWNCAECQRLEAIGAGHPANDFSASGQPWIHKRRQYASLQATVCPRLHIIIVSIVVIVVFVGWELCQRPRKPA